ncbi:MAG: thioredoxin family protein [Gemmatimonadota bacterium]
MKVQILGTGCPKCRALTANAEKAIAELGITAEIEKVEKIADIARMGAMMTPALAVDGDVKSLGVQPVNRVKDILAAAGGGAATEEA